MAKMDMVDQVKALAAPLLERPKHVEFAWGSLADTEHLIFLIVD